MTECFTVVFRGSARNVAVTLLGNYPPLGQAIAASCDDAIARADAAEEEVERLREKLRSYGVEND